MKPIWIATDLSEDEYAVLSKQIDDNGDVILKDPEFIKWLLMRPGATIFGPTTIPHIEKQWTNNKLELTINSELWPSHKFEMIKRGGRE